MQKRLIFTIIFIAYCAVLIKVMVFKDVPVITAGHVTLNFGGTNGGHPANFVPFATIVPYLLGKNGFTIAFLNLVGNIALLVPIGLLAPFVFRNMTWKNSLLLGTIAGLSIEILQTVLNVGIFDIDDVILNGLGVMIGYWVILVTAAWIRQGKYLRIFLAGLLVIATAAGSLYVMYPHGQEQLVSGVGVSSVREQVPQGVDPCGGTGGTGEIVHVGNGTISLKRIDGVIQVMKLSAQTEIKTSEGSASASDLKMGDRVTVVIYDDETATAVLVCNR